MIVEQALRRRGQTLANLGFGQAHSLVISFPRHGWEGRGSMTDKTGHGLIRITCSVMLGVIIRFRPLRRRGDMTIKSACRSSAALTISSAMGPNPMRLE